MSGEGADATLDTGGVLWVIERLCVPWVGELIGDIFLEAHGLCYSIHPGTTNMYRDKRQLY